MAFIICILIMSFTQDVRPDYLFRQSPGGDKSAGLWGGLTSAEERGDATDLYTYGYESLNISHTTQYGIDIEYLTYDPVSNRVLMVVEDPNGLVTSEKHSISFGGLCKSSMAQLHATYHTFKLIDRNNPYLIDTDCGWKCGWGPFGYYNSKVYFVLAGVFGKSYSNLQRQIQIREISGCEDIIESMMNSEHSGTLFEFPVMECSTLIANLYEEEYAKPVPQIETWPAQELKVVEVQGVIHIFLQLFHRNQENAKPYLDLLHINTLISDTGIVISTSPIESVYSGHAKITGLGAIDYKDGVLCWTVTNKLLCGLYNFDGHQIEKTLIVDGQTVIEADVCHTDSLPIEALRQTLTGVAISDTSGSLSIYFGCHADITATGGLGLVRVSHHGLNKRIYPVTSGSHRVYGGHVFVSDTVDVWCEYSGSSSSQTHAKSSTTIETRSTETPPWSESLPSISHACPLCYTVTMIVTNLIVTVNVIM